MIRWYVMRDEGKDGAREWVCYGKNCSRIPWLKMTDDWVRDNGYRTRPAAVQAAGGNHVLNSTNKIRIATLDIAEVGLRYKIYKCYEIVIVDDDGNEVGESNYCYGNKAAAEEMAKHELKLALMDRKEEC